MRHLPPQPDKSYRPVEKCIYCGATTGLSTEHIIPYGLGGRWVLPRSSCAACAKITGAFEGTCQRTILGPLRMHYNLPTRRPRERPATLPLKVKIRPNDDWSVMQVDRNICPFLVLFPILGPPDEVTGSRTEPERGAKAKTFWIRAASFSDGIVPSDPTAYLHYLCKKLKIASVEPTATFTVPEFFRMLAKIAHAYTVAEMGIDGFTPFLLPAILHNDLDDCVQYIGGTAGNEPLSRLTHEISYASHVERPELVVVRIRLFAVLDTPTYIVAAGLRS